MKNNRLVAILKDKLTPVNSLIISVIFTLLFAIYNRIVGIFNESLWNESVSIYYFALTIIKSIILISYYKQTNIENQKRIFQVTKVLLFISNLLMIVPLILMIINKRIVEVSLVFSIGIALYVTIKTTISIINFFKKTTYVSILLKQIKTIDLIDVVFSILTLQNTLISVNGSGFDIGLYYLTIVSSVVGLIINFYLILRMNINEK